MKCSHTTCSREAAPGIKTCAGCAAAMRKASKKYYEKKRKLRGIICSRCMKPVVKGYMLCEYHLAYMKQNLTRFYRRARPKWRANGLCVNCGHPRSSRSLSRCDACMERERKYKMILRKIYKANKRCVCCGAPIEPYLLEYRKTPSTACSSCKEAKVRYDMRNRVT